MDVSLTVLLYIVVVYYLNNFAEESIHCIALQNLSDIFQIKNKIGESRDVIRSLS